MATQTAPTTEPKWPVKTRELQNHHVDSRIWNDFPFRDDDIVVSTWAKSGTTWMQQIISQLITLGDDKVNLHMESPWLDMRMVANEQTVAALEAQTHRRFIKTHLPVDALVYSPKAKYIFVARDGRDTMWSMHNHFHCGNDQFYGMINGFPGRVGPELKKPGPDPVQFFRDFLDNPADPETTHSPFWGHVKGWWDIRELPNILLVHFNDLKADMKSEIRRIAKFLEIDVPEEKWADILHHCTFAYMKENAERMSPPGAELVFEGGAKSFINKGTNGRWTDSLSKEDVTRYEQTAQSELGPDCATWLANGRSPIDI